MATNFKGQIENLTKITIDTDSESIINQWLLDAVREIINRISVINPADTVKFTTTSNTNMNDYIVATGKILSVMRGHDSETILRRASMIDPSNRYDATDVSSLNYRSAYNPGYFILNGKINVIPEPNNSNKLYVSQIKYDDTLTLTSTAIDDFPYEYEYLVPMYASIKLLFRQMSVIEEELTSTFFPDPPTPPDITAGEISIGAIDVPEFKVPSMNLLDWNDANKWIDKEEDSEMLKARVTEIESKMREYTVLLEGAKGKFEEDKVKFQADINVAMENVKHLDEKEQREVQLFAQEVLNYEKKIQEELQRYQYEVIAKTTKKYEWLTMRWKSLLEDYNSAFSLMGNISKKQEQPQQQRRQ